MFVAKNAELVRSLGADKVIDYQKEDFANGVKNMMSFLMRLGRLHLTKSRNALKDKGVYLTVGMDVNFMSVPSNERNRNINYLLGCNQPTAEELYFTNLMEDGTLKPVDNRELILCLIFNLLTNMRKQVIREGILLL
ncbi:MAG: zinc-binding dehydrogenase [Bacteroidia bacterium]